MAGESDSENPTQRLGSSLWDRALSFAPALGVLVVVAAAAAYYSGLIYVQAYADEWGISFSALNYNTYELMTASTWTLTLAIFVPIFGYVLFQFRASVLEQGALPRRRASRIFFGLVQRARISDRRLVSMVIIVFFLSIFFALPNQLGFTDAQRDRDNPDHLPRVHLASSRALGLAGEAKDGDLCVSGPWRLIFFNNGYVWLTTISGGGGSPCISGCPNGRSKLAICQCSHC